jgi:hypothetical protein
LSKVGDDPVQMIADLPCFSYGLSTAAIEATGSIAAPSTTIFAWFPPITRKLSEPIASAALSYVNGSADFGSIQIGSVSGA